MTGAFSAGGCRPWWRRPGETGGRLPARRPEPRWRLRSARGPHVQRPVDRLRHPGPARRPVVEPRGSACDSLPQRLQAAPAGLPRTRARVARRRSPGSGRSCEGRRYRSGRAAQARAAAAAVSRDRAGGGPPPAPSGGRRAVSRRVPPSAAAGSGALGRRRAGGRGRAGGLSEPLPDRVLDGVSRPRTARPADASGPNVRRPAGRRFPAGRRRGAGGAAGGSGLVSLAMPRHGRSPSTPPRLEPAAPHATLVPGLIAVLRHRRAASSGRLRSE